MSSARYKRLRFLALIVSAAFCFTRYGVPEETPRLPVFELTDLGGNPTPSSSLVEDRAWLLVYVQRKSGPCDQLLNVFKKDDLLEPRRIKIIVGGASMEDAEAFVAKFPALAGVVWYVDPPGASFEALKLSGVPVVLGLKGDRIAWRLAGVFKSSEMRSILLSWIRE